MFERILLKKLALDASQEEIRKAVHAMQTHGLPPGTKRKFLLYGLGIGLGTLGVSALAPLISGGIRSLLLSRKQERAFRQAHAIFPELLTYPEEQRRLFFETLKTISPTVASDPVLAGTFLKGTLAQGGIDPMLVRSLIGIEPEPSRIFPEITKEIIAYPTGHLTSELLAHALMG